MVTHTQSGHASSHHGFFSIKKCVVKIKIWYAKTKRNPSTFSCLDMEACPDSEPVEPCVQVAKLYSIHASNYILLAGRKKVHVLSLHLTSILCRYFNFCNILTSTLSWIECQIRFSTSSPNLHTRVERFSLGQKNCWSQRKT